MRKIRWGVLGTAGIARGQTIPGMLQADNCILTAIAGRNADKAADFQREFGFEKAYDSYEALLSDPEIEAVYIPLPNVLHLEWTIKALEAGKHVLCEKPLAPTCAEAQHMIDTARENGVLLMEAFAYLHSPLIAAIKSELDRGVIGNVVYLENAFITSDYMQSNIRMRRETFGGCTYDLGCYTTSETLWLLDKEPRSVKAIADFGPSGVDMLTNAILSFDDGARASLTFGMVLKTEANERIDRLEIRGTEGRIVSGAPFNGRGALSYTVQNGDGIVTRTIEIPHNYRLEVEQFGRAICGEETPHVSNAFTMKNMQVVERILHEIGY